MASHVWEVFSEEKARWEADEQLTHGAARARLLKHGLEELTDYE